MKQKDCFYRILLKNVCIYSINTMSEQRFIAILIHFLDRCTGKLFIDYYWYENILINLLYISQWYIMEEFQYNYKSIFI